MLKITSDGRKLGLDQRIINPMLPDEPGTKVNRCVANILRHWRDGEADRLARLRVMKADYQSKRFRLEDDALKRFPAGIARTEAVIAGIRADMETLSAHPYPEDGFVGMKINGRTYLEKDKAGEALLDAISDVSQTDPVEIGSYRGLIITAKLALFGTHDVAFKGAVAYAIDLGDSPAGNIIRIDNALAKLPERLEDAEAKLADLQKQMESAKAEAAKPFAMEEELRTKSARLAELDAALNLGSKAAPEQTAA